MTSDGLAQRQRRDREPPSHYRANSKNALLAERQSRCPLEPVLGGPYAYKDSTPVDLIDGG